MRLAFHLPLLIAALAVLPACESGNSAPGVKIGVADVSRLMRDSAPGKAGIKFLESRQAQFQKELDDIQARLEKDPQDEGAMRDLQRVYAASQQQIQAEGQNVAALLFDSLQRVLDNYRERNGFTVILSQDTVASFAKSADVTAEVMKELDKENIEFKPLPEQAAAGMAIPGGGLPGIDISGPSAGEEKGAEEKAAEEMAPAASEAGQSLEARPDSAKQEEAKPGAAEQGAKPEGAQKAAKPAAGKAAAKPAGK